MVRECRDFSGFLVGFSEVSPGYEYEYEYDTKNLTCFASPQKKIFFFDLKDWFVTDQSFQTQHVTMLYDYTPCTLRIDS